MPLLKVPNRPGVLIDTDRRTYILNVQTPMFRERIETMPNVHLEPYKAGALAVLPIQDDVLIGLEQRGIRISGMEPFHFDYTPPLINGNRQPWDHQLEGAAFMSLHKRCYNLSTPRTGKTGAAIMAADYLQKSGRVRGAVLVISTVTSLSATWKKALKTTLPQARINIVHGGTGKKDRIKQLHQGGDWLVINYDGVKMIPDELKALVKQGIISIIIVDEVTHYGDPASDLWKAGNYVINGADAPVEYCWGLTGTAVAGDNISSISVPYGIMKVVNPTNMPCRHKTTWLEMVTYKEPWMTESWQCKVRPDYKDIIFRAMQPAIRYEKELLFPDIPKPEPEDIRVEMTAIQQSHYDDMREEMLVMLESGETISAANKAVKMRKLFQIAAGILIKHDGKIEQLNYTPRLNKLLEIIRTAKNKVVIFSEYIGVNDRLVADLKKAGVTVARIDGRVSEKKRADIIQKFQEEDDPFVLVCHPRTTAYCIELARADTMVFNGPPTVGNFIYQQAIERLASVVQEAEKINFIQLTASPEESKFFKGLNQGVKASAMVNRLFTEKTLRR